MEALQDKKYQLNLDIVRLLAVLLVCSVHLGQWFPQLGDWTEVGAKGVLLFFILSGYLNEKSLENKGSFKEYIVEKIRRIVPTYYLVLILIYVWDLIQYTWSWGFTAAISGPCNPFKYARYFLFLQVFIPSSDPSLWCNRYALWTMSSIAFFYLIAGLLHKVIHSFYPSLILLLVMLCVRSPMVTAIQSLLDSILPYADGYHAYHTPFVMLYLFLFGTTLYYAVKEHREFQYISLLLAIMIFSQFGWYNYEIIFTVLVCAGAKLSDIKTGEKGRKFIRSASEGSFTFYLCHLMLVSVSNYILKRLPLSSNVKLLITVLFLVTVGYGLWWFIVRKVQKWFDDRILKISEPVKTI